MIPFKIRKTDNKVISKITLRDGKSGCQTPANQASYHSYLSRPSFFIQGVTMIGFRNMERVYRDMEIDRDKNEAITLANRLNEMTYGKDIDYLNIGGDSYDDTNQMD